MTAHPDSEGQLFLIAEGLSEQIKALGNLVDARLHERDRLMDERFRDRDVAVTVASDEREKAASALRAELERAIQEGDERLREHIATQSQQINAALLSADRLELSRVAATDARVDALGREVQIVNAASAEAIAKAEAATTVRFDSVNAFREQLASLIASFLPREVFDTTVTQWAEWRSGVDADRSTLRGRGEQRSEARLTQGAFIAVIACGVGVLGLLVVFANLITSH